jgi:hypothetical protein
VIVPAIVFAAACHGTSPLQPPAVVLFAHVTGSVKDQHAQVLRGVDVTLICPSPSADAAYPQSARLANSRATDNSGVYQAWLGIDEASLRQSSRDATGITMSCTVLAQQGPQQLTVMPSTVAVRFTPVIVSEAITTADLTTTL